MKKKHSFHFWTPRSLVFRLSALFLCVLVPLDGLGFLLFRSGYNTISRQIRNESRSSLQYISQSVESSVETLLWDLYELESNMELRRLASSGGMLERYKFYQSVESVRDYVDILAKNNPWVEYITVYLPASSIYISSQQVQKNGYTAWQYGEYEADELETLIAQARARRERYALRRFRPVRRAFIPFALLLSGPHAVLCRAAARERGGHPFLPCLAQIV